MWIVVTDQVVCTNMSYLLVASCVLADVRARVQAIGREARALFNIAQAEGLTMWSPNVNIFRDPRWGRGQETPGEDPAVASSYAAAFVRGIQGNGSSLLQTSACCKHATPYDLEDWGGVQRYSFVARVTAQDLEDTFNPPFRSCVADSGATCVMCAYTAVNGVPSCADAGLLTGTVRGDWGLDGYVASDCDAVAIMRDAQRYAASPEDAVAVALKAGESPSSLMTSCLHCSCPQLAPLLDHSVRFLCFELEQVWTSTAVRTSSSTPRPRSSRAS